MSRYGLSLVVVQTNTTAATARLTSVMKHLLSFPLGNVISEAKEIDLTSTLVFNCLQDLTSSEALQSLRSLVPQRGSGVHPDNIRWKTLYSVLLRASVLAQTSGRLTEKIYLVLEQLLRATIDVWSAQEEELRLKALEDAKQFKYMSKTQEEQTDELMADLYPDFTQFFVEKKEIDDLEDESGVGGEKAGDDIEATAEEQEKALRKLSTQHMSNIFDSFMQVFSRASGASEETAPASLDKRRVDAFSTSYSAASDIAACLQTSGQVDQIPHSVDDQSYLGHVFMASVSFGQINPKLLRTRVSSKKVSAGLSGDDDTVIDDMWKSGNLVELIRLEKPLTELTLRLRQLLDEFPQHPVLIQLIRLCHRIASLPCDCPVMKMLAGVETLLKTAETWEAYAAKHVSIKRELKDMSTLVARWRKMELHSWPFALAFRRENCREDTIRWWFKLYGLIHLTTTDLEKFFSDGKSTRASHISAADAYVTELYTALDEFVQYCTIGDLPTRLDILDAFRRQLSIELAGRFAFTNDRLPAHTRAQIASIVTNIHAYYSQFLPLYDAYMKRHYGPIAKELKEQVQLAKWDLSNYYSLQTSSERSHRKLLKFSNEYELLLRTAFRTLLGKAEQADTKDEKDDTVEFGKSPSVSLDSVPDFSELIVSPDATDWYQTVVTVVGPAAGGAAEKPLPSLCASAKSLLRKGFFSDQLVSAREDATQEIAGITSSLAGRVLGLKGSKIMLKKKALVDSLKLLKSIGLSHRSQDLAAGGETDDLSKLFQASPLTLFGPWASIHSPATGMSASSLHLLASKCEQRMPNLLSGIRKMRSRVRIPHKDLNVAEVSRSRGMVEHLLSLIFSLRGKLSSAVLEHQALEQYAILFSDVPVACSAAAHMELPTLDNWFWTQKDLIDSCLEAAESHLLLYSQLQGTSSVSAEDNVYAETQLQQMITSLKACKTTLDEQINQLFPQQWLPNFHASAWINCSKVRYATFLQTNFVALRAAMSSQLSSSVSLNTDANWKALSARVSATIARFESEWNYVVDTSSLPSTSSDDAEPPQLDQQTAVRYADVVSALLLSVQKMYTLTQVEATETAGFVLDEFRLASSWFKSLAFVSINKAIVNLLQSDSSEHAKLVACRNLCPLIQQVLRQGRAAFLFALKLYDTSANLLRVLLAVLNVLLVKGFCRVEEKEEEDEEENTEDNVEGTGMGEGEGKDDVSNQIEDEEQLLGLKDDSEDEKDNQEPGEPEKGDDTGVEMDGRFDGDMMDVPSDEENEDNDEKSDDDQEELDREMADLEDEEKDVVDEKLWDESDEEEGKDKDEKFEKDAPIHGGGQEDEMMADDDADDDKKKEPEPPPADDEKVDDRPEKDEQPEDEDDSKMDDEAEGEDEGEDPINPNTEDRFEENHEIEPMELPDDLNLDGEEKEEDGEGEGDEEEEEPPQVDDDAPDDDDGKEISDGDDPNMDDSANPDEPPEPQPEEQDGMDQSFEEIEEQEEDPNENDQDNPESTVELPDLPPEVKDRKDDAQAQRGSEAADEGQGVEAENNEEDQPDVEEQDDRPEQNTSQEAQAQSGARRERTKEDQQPNPSQQEQPPQRQQPEKKEEKQANPYKSFADASKKWEEKLEILERYEDKEKELADEEAPEQADEDNMQGDLDTVEKVGEKEEAEAHALGAHDETVEALPMDEKEEEEPPEDAPADAVDDTAVSEDGNKDEEDPDKSSDSKDRGGKQMLAKPLNPRMDADEPEKMEEDQMMDDEKVSDSDAEDEDEAARPTFVGDYVMDTKAANSEAPATTLSREELLALREELRADVNNWDNAREAHELWSKLEALTDDLSQQLCEQLRTVLEPLLATRLKGDYRSGKRINIKKIIPYIASQFRKDKIWLRRTKPNKRMYQVCLAIDDSASMRVNGAHVVALEALTVLSRVSSLSLSLPLSAHI